MKNRTKHIRSCQRKRKFTRDSAYATARRLNRKGYFLRAYKCPVCDGWHLTKCSPVERVAMAFERLAREERI